MNNRTLNSDSFCIAANVQESTCAAMRDLVLTAVQNLDGDKDTLQSLISWLVFHLFTAGNGGEEATLKYIRELIASQANQKEFTQSKCIKTPDCANDSRIGGDFRGISSALLSTFSGDAGTIIRTKTAGVVRSTLVCTSLYEGIFNDLPQHSLRNDRQELAKITKRRYRPYCTKCCSVRMTKKSNFWTDSCFSARILPP